jgi:vancomycin resistance protein YoaR
MRPWLRFDPTTDGLHLAVDEAKVSTDLPNVLAAATKPAVETSFVVDGDAVVVHPGTSGLVCCDAAAPAAIAKALLSSPRPSDPVALQLRPLAPKIPPEEIAKVGISKPVGTFTVTYRPEKTKSLDVQLAADNLRGRVVLPGETFSMNVALGQPTPERGFQTRVPRSTPAAFADDVLGSLNDLANSMFNASFVGGLDLFSYRTRPVHSTTYPSGREVDVGWPTPDLQIRNSTPYGVLLWITYTDSSVTVTLWSTPTFASVVQSNQTSTPDGPCTRVVTERTKTLLDGTQQVDSISAIYQPDAATKCPSG